MKTARIARLQAMCDRNIAEYGLVERLAGMGEGMTMEHPFAITLDVGTSPHQSYRLLAHAAAGIRSPPAALQSCMPGGRGHPGLAGFTPKAAITKRPGAR